MLNPREYAKMEIDNFICYAFSDDKEREQFRECLNDYMNEVYETPYDENQETDEDIHYEVYEVIGDDIDQIDSFDNIDEALSLLNTLKFYFENRHFYADKWNGHGLNANVGDIEEDIEGA